MSTSCSLLHTAVDLVNETKLDDEIKSWLAFAAQKIVEVNALATALSGKKDEVVYILLVVFTFDEIFCSNNLYVFIPRNNYAILI